MRGFRFVKCIVVLFLPCDGCDGERRLLNTENRHGGLEFAPRLVM